MSDESALDAVMAIMDAAFESRWGEAWTRAQLRDSLAMPSTFLILADRDAAAIQAGPAAGFVLSRQALDEEELLLLAVRPEERAHGLGAALVQLHFAAARRRGVHRIFLEMRANNPAHSLYRRCGFEPIGVRPRYYRPAEGEPIDAITFARQLSE